MSTRRIRLVVVGAGAFGREHLLALSAIDDVEIAGIADLNEATAIAAARTHGVAQSGTDVGELLGRVEADGLILATPAQTHVPLATAGLRRGLWVLVEKPVGLSAGEARTLVEAEARSAGSVLPGHVLRFSEPHRALVELAQSPEIGQILSVSSRRYRDGGHALRYPDIDPAFMTMIHDIDLALWITGAQPTNVYALRSPAGMQRSQTTMLARDSVGAAWHLATAWTYSGEEAPPDRIEVVGQNGGVELEVGSHIRQYGAATRHIDLSETAADVPLRAELEYFLACIRAGRRPTVVTLEVAVAGLRVAEAVMSSLQSGDVVRL